MAEGRKGVAGAEVGLEQVALDEGEALGEAEATDGVARDGDDLRPVNRGDGDVRRGLHQRNAPDAGAGGEIEDADRRGEVQMPGERQRRGVAHGEDVVDELVEELAARVLLIDRLDGFAGGDDFVEAKEFWDQLLAAVTDDSTLEAGLGTDQERGAFGCEGEAALRVFGEEAEADEGVGDGAKAALGGVGLGVQLLDGHGAAVEDIEDAVADSGLKHEGWNIAPGKLHDAFGSYGGGCSSRHGLSLSVGNGRNYTERWLRR